MILGYKVEHNGKASPDDLDGYSMEDSDAKEYPFMVTDEHMIMMFHKPMSLEDALEYSKVPEEDLITT